MSYTEKIEKLKENIKSFPDFPKTGVLFRDIFSVLGNPEAFATLQELLVDYAKQLDIEYIVGLESRGFLIGTTLALALKIPFVPIRKKGKLPGKTKSVSFTLEYGQDVFEMQENSIKKSGKVLIVDDLLATGGSLAASCELVKLFGGIVVECLVIMELVFLKGREKVPAKVHSLIQY